MWKLFKAEFNYNKITILPLLCTVPVASLLLITQTDGDASIAVILFAYIIAYTVIARMHKEKRDSRFVFLPVSIRKVGLNRVLLIFIPFVSVFFLFFIFQALLGREAHESNKYIAAFFGLYLLGFAVYLVLRDLVLNILRKSNSFKLTKIAVLLGLFSLTLGLVAFTATYTRLGEFPWIIQMIGTFFDFVFSTTGLFVIPSLSLLLFCLSIFTFVRRKSYIR